MAATVGTLYMKGVKSQAVHAVDLQRVRTRRRWIRPDGLECTCRCEQPELLDSP